MSARSFFSCSFFPEEPAFDFSPEYADGSFVKCKAPGPGALMIVGLAVLTASVIHRFVDFGFFSRACIGLPGIGELSLDLDDSDSGGNLRRWVERIAMAFRDILDLRWLRRRLSEYKSSNLIVEAIIVCRTK